MLRILVGITGASGVIYGVRLIEELRKHGVETHLIISDKAKKILEIETNYKTKDIEKLAFSSYDNHDLFSAPSSGSYKLDGMVVSPCSVKSLSSIANGFCDNLISRSAVCCLKEERKLVIVLRETPLDFSTINNIKTAKIGGATILPAMPAFYHSPKNIDDLIDFIVGKILDQFGIKHDLFRRWE
jgi:4-hydroxy-3-polyprenylbenzoate decarboxylase